ncbi:trigger factor [Roseovarius sp. A21]|uniref:Trigger factor n=1 Tax=Roseovarius bejariae TaxID=2576383 RepID=A0A844CX70_9RHOB|nr:DUF6314 family protein [Roseovarius bejariae]MRU14223.1 trigger factor [Roseovarius bejariae]
MTMQLADFEGEWRLERRIVQADGVEARLQGVAVFRAVPEGLAYEEIGTLRVPGQPEMEARRAYLWGPDLSVWFDDGRFFHRVPAEGGETGHWCDPDQYDGRYEFEEWPVWRVTWDVRGPRKDYRMESEYRR